MIGNTIYIVIFNLTEQKQPNSSRINTTESKIYVLIRIIKSITKNYNRNTLLNLNRHNVYKLPFVRYLLKMKYEDMFLCFQIAFNYHRHHTLQFYCFFTLNALWLLLLNLVYSFERGLLFMSLVHFWKTPTRCTDYSTPFVSLNALYFIVVAVVVFFFHVHSPETYLQSSLAQLP